MAWLDRAIQGLSTLPLEVTNSLDHMRVEGIKNRDCAKGIQEEEIALLGEIQEAIKTGADIDESAVKAKAETLNLKRKELSSQMDMQTKAAAEVYEKCGKFLSLWTIKSFPVFLIQTFFFF